MSKGRRVVARRREDHEIFIIVYEESYRVGCCPHTSTGQAVDFIFIMSSCVKADADDNNLLVFGGELLRPIFMTYDATYRLPSDDIHLHDVI